MWLESSALVQVTVVPAATVMLAGTNTIQPTFDGIGRRRRGRRRHFDGHGGGGQQAGAQQQHGQRFAAGHIASRSGGVAGQRHRCVQQKIKDPARTGQHEPGVPFRSGLQRRGSRCMGKIVPGNGGVRGKGESPTGEPEPFLSKTRPAHCAGQKKIHAMAVMPGVDVDVLAPLCDERLVTVIPG